ncbi:nitrogenase component 1 [Clostridium saccharoperbutylacetonicum]|uniref:nitrogenase component 1 n=1 Tax=Clostridium saccharoperbutylacetonicum TaxID=36745 RepID=UPI000983D1D7|nr:nitrogenase component 1 [Clostridium saccharoperbutylacetonicum]AQR94076.1 nitrogenase molybdenum-iron protein beta chain [Clostridium saccharoperbutylacetonicum]NSB29775.1 nitrogenase molybdenum-iron protein beta chain [Clostridium saccharoperbutylacetonicum]
MAKILDQPRYKCALAAMQTVQSIDGAIPILHAGPGCGAKLGGGAGNSGHFSHNIFPCTNISEKEVVFGGEKKLREIVENSLKVIDAELYVVLTSCTSEVIGDDAEEIARSFREKGKPVIFSSTPGFKGNNYLGHEWVIDAIIDQYLESSDEKIKGLVNIWAGIPLHDPFWLGNLRELEKLIEQLGLIPNTIFGHDRGIKNLKRVPKAEFNLLVSPWLGLNNVKKLESKFGTPYLHYPVLPIGAAETSKFLRAVGDFAKIDKKKVEEIIEKQEKEYYYYIERFADVFLETRVMAKRFVVVSDSQYSLAITKFLVNDLGLFPAKQYIIDDAPEKYRKSIEGYFKELNYDIEAEVEFSVDGYKIHDEIRNTDYHGYPLILGSSWEKKVAKQTDAHYLSISWPINERLVINSSYVGYAGGLKLLEDIYSVVLTRFN